MTPERISGPKMDRNARRAFCKLFSSFISRGFYQWGHGSRAAPPLRVNGEGWISIGRSVYMGADCWLNAEPLEAVTLPVILIGDGCNFTGACMISAVRLVALGKDVLVARNVYIADHDHAYADTSQAIIRQGVGSVGEVVIEDGAWLGQNVVVTSGVRIGRGAVVGANAVVTADVPDYSLAVGAPARVVKTWSSNH